MWGAMGAKNRDVDERGFRIGLVILFLMLISLPSVHSFQVLVDPIKYAIFPNETALYNLTIINDHTVERYLSISSPDVLDWDISTIPRSDYYIHLLPNSSRSVLIAVRHLYASSGQYLLSIDVSDDKNGMAVEKRIPVSLKSSSSRYAKYSPSISVSLEITKMIDPRNPFSAYVTLKNNVPENYSGVEVRLKSGIIEKSKTVNLVRGESKRVVFTLNLPRNQPPLGDIMVAEVYLPFNNRTFVFTSPPQTFRVIPFTELKKEEKTEKGLFKSHISLIFSNSGNSIRETVVRKRVNFFSRMFMKVSPDARLATLEGRSYFVWDLNIPAGGQVKIDIFTNYISFVVSLIVLLLIVVSYFYFRSPVVLKKSASFIGSKNSLTELKVRLFIRNRTGHTLEHITVVDKIPPIAQIEKAFIVGTLKPSRISSTPSKNTILRWEIPIFEPYEERIITYNIKSKLTIIGGIALPKSYITFTFKGKKRRVRSNTFVLSV